MPLRELTSSRQSRLPTRPLSTKASTKASTRASTRASARAKAKRGRAADAEPIPVHIRAAEVDLTADDRKFIRRKLGRRLGAFSGSIERVSVRIEDPNGPRGGVDRVCRIKVVLAGLPTVVVEKRAAALNGAVDGALTGAAKAVRRSVQRRRMKPLRRTA